jgi:transposase-like protein
VTAEDNSGFWVYLTGVASEDNALLKTPTRREIPRCKRCGSENVVKFGQLKSVQRWLCKDCRRKFADNKAFPGMKIPAEQIAWALCLYYEGFGFKEICRYLQRTYHSFPSDSTVYSWIEKFTKKALDAAARVHPQVGEVWAAIITPVKIGGNNIWFWDILDAGSRFMLASHTSPSLTPEDAAISLAQATKRAGKKPRKIITDHFDIFMRRLEAAKKDGSNAIVTGKVLHASDAELLEEYRATLNTRTTVMRRLKSFDSARDFIEAWPLHYNFFRPHEVTNHTTPAYRAGIRSPLKIKLP